MSFLREKTKTEGSAWGVASTSTLSLECRNSKEWHTSCWAKTIRDIKWSWIVADCCNSLLGTRGEVSPTKKCSTNGHKLHMFPVFTNTQQKHPRPPPVIHRQGKSLAQLSLHQCPIYSDRKGTQLCHCSFVILLKHSWPVALYQSTSI